MSELEHVVRPSLPWRRDEARTECGLLADERTAITRDAFFAKFKRLGQQRTALTTCMTCWQTAQRWPTWEDDPVRALGREVSGAALRVNRRGVVRNRSDGQGLEAELRAIAALVEAHRQEFDDYIAGLGETADLSEKRAAHRYHRGGAA